MSIYLNTIAEQTLNWGMSVSLFAHNKVLALEHGFGVGADLVLLSEVDLVSRLVLAADVSVTELSRSHLVFKTVVRVEIHRKHGGELIFEIFIKEFLLTFTYILVLVVHTKLLVQFSVFIANFLSLLLTFLASISKK